MHCQNERHRLAEVIIDAPPQPDGGDDRAEVVVQQDDRCCLARHIGATPPHRHADIGGPERGRVIHPVAGHGNDRAAGLQRLDDPQFLFGQDTGKDGGGLNRGRKVGIRHCGQCGAVDGHISANPGVPGDGQRRGRVVAGDHDDLDSGRFALGHGGGNRRAQRVGKAHEAEEPMVEIVLVRRQVPAGNAGFGHTQNAQTAGRHRIHRLQHRLAGSCVQMAEVGDCLGRALGGDHVLARRIGFGPDLRHRQQVGRQRVGPDQLVPVTRQGLAGAQIRLGQQMECLFHRIKGFRGRCHHPRRRQFPKGIGHAVLAGVEHLPVGQMKGGNRHAVFRQGAGLVGAQHRRRPQGLDR